MFGRLFSWISSSESSEEVVRANRQNADSNNDQTESNAENAETSGSDGADSFELVDRISLNSVSEADEKQQVEKCAVGVRRLRISSPDELQQDIDRLCELIDAGDEKADELLKTLTRVRKALTNSQLDYHSTIDAVIASGVLVKVRGLLTSSRADMLREATWLLINVSGGTAEQTRAIVSADLVPLLAGLLDSTDALIVEHAVWCLSNVAHDGADAFEACFAADIVTTLTSLPLFADLPTLNAQLASLVVDLAHNLLRFGRERLYGLAIEDLFSLLFDATRHSDAGVITNALKSLVHFSQKGDLYLDFIVASKHIHRPIQLLMEGDESLQEHAIKLLENILCGSEEQAQRVIDRGILGVLPLLMFSDALRHHAVRCVSNIAAGNHAQIDRLTTEHSLLRDTIRYMNKPEDRQTQLEAAWTALNLVTCANNGQLIAIIHRADLARQLYTAIIKTKSMDAEAYECVMEAAVELVRKSRTDLNLWRTFQNALTPNQYAKFLKFPSKALQKQLNALSGVARQYAH